MLYNQNPRWYQKPCIIRTFSLWLHLEITEQTRLLTLSIARASSVDLTSFPLGRLGWEIISEPTSSSSCEAAIQRSYCWRAGHQKGGVGNGHPGIRDKGQKDSVKTNEACMRRSSGDRGQREKSRRRCVQRLSGDRGPGIGDT